MRHCGTIAFGPHCLSLVVAMLVLLVTNTGVRRPGYEGRGITVESKQQVYRVRLAPHLHLQD